MNNPQPPPATPLDWGHVEAAIGAEQTQILRKNNAQRKRWRFGANGVLIGAGALLAILIALALLAAAGCATRGTYTTLAATEQAVKSSYDGYLDSVITGQSRTNDLPVIAKSFDAFQSAFAVAVDKASGDTNAPITGDLSVAAANLLKAITAAKGLK